ncbi:MAG: 1-acyl-sn-glycerol-3-phosphate acyltransferase [Nocardioidaceae bacterium]|nr:1-acyl-sn-glycerol-3-phosphate acyltransferase [Nocardioidaceae bacterium]
MSALGARDPAYVAKAMPALKVAMKTYFRSRVTGMDKMPAGGALIVGNHSGGLMPMDVPIIAVAFADAFGAERPLYCLAHDLLFTGAAGPVMRKYGFVNATRTAAHEILTGGGVTIVFPGGDYDTFRPTLHSTDVDFHGRTGYVRTALRAGAPIVPVVSLGGQESQLFLTRGEWFGKRAPWRRAIRTDLFPIGLGFPFGLAPAPLNLPLPTKISTRVLDPIDIEAEFGPDPDIAEVDRTVRDRMHDALVEMARSRRFPVIG